MTSAPLSIKAGKTNPCAGDSTIQSLIRDFIAFSSSKYLKPAFDNSTGQIAHKIYSYTSSDSSNLALSVVLVMISYASWNINIRKFPV